MQSKSSNVLGENHEVMSSNREPIAGKPHDGFCGGGNARKSGSLLTMSYLVEQCLQMKQYKQHQILINKFKTT